ncbi:MAG: hypothetical protein J5802_00760 [Butyrivibrio sp.]|nr:hypothetical protein [Butyrivibrio sp.]
MDTNSIDIIGKRVDGGIDLVIIVPDEVENSEDIQTQLLDKIENYLKYANSEEFKKDFPDVISGKVTLKLRLGKTPSERLLKWVDEIGSWVKSSGVKFSV